MIPAKFSRIYYPKIFFSISTNARKSIVKFPRIRFWFEFSSDLNFDPTTTNKLELLRKIVILYITNIYEISNWIFDLLQKKGIKIIRKLEYSFKSFQEFLANSNRNPLKVLIQKMTFLVAQSQISYELLKYLLVSTKIWHGKLCLWIGSRSIMFNFD